jgi:hypothetical protein
MMSGIDVKIVADSIINNNRLVTYQLKFHRFVLAEFNTHRVFSRNASSSRAIPVNTMLKQVWNDPAIPIQFGSNKAGMQAGEELTGVSKSAARFLWKTAGKVACVFAYGMMKVGLHKQWANRVLEPWQFIHVIVSATEWENFFNLRCHPDAQPEIHELANQMRLAYQFHSYSRLKMGEWHLPYISKYERDNYDLETLKKVSTARCCRVSYLKHDGSVPSVEDDIKLYARLVGSIPIHASPAEHPAMAIGDDKFHSNFKGWMQHRSEIETFNLEVR